MIRGNYLEREAIPPQLETEEALEIWLGLKAAGSPHTARAYRTAVRQFLGAVSRPLGELTPADAARYLLYLRGQGLAKATCAQHVSAVRSYLEFCCELGLIDEPPLSVLVAPRVDVISAPHLTREQAERLLAAAERDSLQAHGAIRTMLSTGVRVRELTEAEWRDVFEDADGRMGLKVRHGKGGRSRVVLIQPGLVEVLQLSRAGLGLVPGLDCSDRTPLVPKPNGQKYSTSGMWRLVRRVARLAGLKEPVSPHWLRHTFGTLAASAGATAFELQKTLGHRHPSTSERYVHVANDLQSSAARFVSYGGQI